MTGEGSVEIRNTVFENNVAGSGSALSVVGSGDLKVVGTTFAPAGSMKTIYTDGVSPYDCTSHPCDAGYGCSLSQLSLFCTRCGADQFSTDGRACRACSPGTQSNDNRTTCVLCPDGTFSSGVTGACQRCAVGRVSSEHRRNCLDCPVGSATGLGTVCEPCGLSHYASAGALFCEECPAGETHTDDHSGCIPCAVSAEFATTTAQPVRAVGTSSCMLCPDGTVSSMDGTSCVTCSQPGQFSVGGLACTDCAAGKQPNANKSHCETCPPGTAGIGGVCIECDAGKQVAPSGASCNACSHGQHSRDGAPCVACPPGTQPTLDQSSCESCVLYERTFSAHGAECIECSTREMPSSDKTECVCALDHYSLGLYGEIDCLDKTGTVDDGNYGALDSCAFCPSCLRCDELGKVHLEPGFAFYGAGFANRCPVDAGCPGGPVPNASAASLMWFGNSFSKAALDSQCAVGYTGPICGQCDGDWNHLKVGKPCEPCRDGKLNVAMALMTLVATFVAAGLVISGAFKVLKDNGIVTDARLIVPIPSKLSHTLSHYSRCVSNLTRGVVFEQIGFYQMLSQMR